MRNFNFINHAVHAIHFFETTLRGDKLFILDDNGVYIIPTDYSYRRFISNSWYNDINTDNL